MMLSDAELPFVTCKPTPFVYITWHPSQVFTPFLRQYQAGATPNPDLGCNNTIKFGELLHVAAGFGAEALATGRLCSCTHVSLVVR
jgi:tRNA U34 2-thiouridine synthase MnmA/TrmU